MKEVDKIVYDNIEKYEKMNNYLLKGIELPSENKERLIFLQALIDETGKIELKVTQIADINKKRFQRAVNLQAFTNKKGKIELLREV